MPRGLPCNSTITRQGNPFMNPQRRQFLLGSAAAAIALSSDRGAAAKPEPAQKPMRILILGGTGFIGPHQVRHALARGHQVTLFNRGKRAAPQWPGDVEVRLGDRNTGDLKSLAKGEWDVCIDNPTSLPFWVRDAARVLKDRVGHYQFVSTLSVFSNNAVPNDESGALAKYEGKDAMAETMDSFRANVAALYGPLKAACEAAARKHFGNRACVVRPGLIVGPGDETDRFSYWPVRIARGGEVAAPGDGSDPVQFIDVRDLAEWMIHLAEQRVTGTYNAVGPDYELSMAAFLHAARAVQSKPAKLVWLPTAFLEKQQVAPWSDMPVWVPGTGESAGFARTINARAISGGLKFRPLAETCFDTLNWHQGLDAKRQSELRAGLKPEREAALLRAFREQKPA
jgi:2'-hydroxyisoflavone reductase